MGCDGTGPLHAPRLVRRFESTWRGRNLSGFLSIRIFRSHKNIQIESSIQRNLAGIIELTSRGSQYTDTGEVGAFRICSPRGRKGRKWAELS